MLIKILLVNREISNHSAMHKWKLGVEIISAAPRYIDYLTDWHPLLHQKKTVLCMKIKRLIERPLIRFFNHTLYARQLIVRYEFKKGKAEMAFIILLKWKISLNFELRRRTQKRQITSFLEIHVDWVNHANGITWLQLLKLNEENGHSSWLLFVYECSSNTLPGNWRMLVQSANHATIQVHLKGSS